MQTIGKHAGKAHEGDFVATCAYCGVAWYRSRLVRNAAGQLICPDHQHIRDPVTLSRLNAQRSSRLSARRIDGGLADKKPATGLPSVISGANIAAGWEATDATTTLSAGGRVSEWSALSGGSGAKLFSFNAARRPRYKYDGPSNRRYVSFENSHFMSTFAADSLVRPAPSVEPTFYWGVVRQTRSPSISVWWTYLIGAGLTLAAASIGATLAQSAGTSVNFTALPIGQFKLVEMSFTGSSADYIRVGSTRTANGTSAGVNAPNDIFILGSALSGALPANPSWLDVCELWQLKAVPSASELDRLEEVARSKYGSLVIQ